MKADQSEAMDLDLPAEFGSCSPSHLRSLFVEERQRCVVLEKDLFKAQVECRKLDVQLKAVQELNTVNAKNRNNTSSAFTLPSEFKGAWDELVTEHIIDAFSNIDQYEVVVPLVHELFIMVRDEIITMERKIIVDIGHSLHIITDDQNNETRE